MIMKESPCRPCQLAVVEEDVAVVEEAGLEESATGWQIMMLMEVGMVDVDTVAEGGVVEEVVVPMDVEEAMVVATVAVMVVATVVVMVAVTLVAMVLAMVAEICNKNQVDMMMVNQGHKDVAVAGEEGFEGVAEDVAIKVKIRWTRP